MPCGADGLPDVKALPLPASPAEPLNVQADPDGSYWYADQPVPSLGVSKPGSVGCTIPPVGGATLPVTSPSRSYKVCVRWPAGSIVPVTSPSWS